MRQNQGRHAISHVQDIQKNSSNIEVPPLYGQSGNLSLSLIPSRFSPREFPELKIAQKTSRVIETTPNLLGFKTTKRKSTIAKKTHVLPTATTNNAAKKNSESSPAYVTKMNPSPKLTGHLQHRHRTRVLLLTGTPCLDRPIDLYYQLCLVCPDALSEHWKTHEAFGKYFCKKFWFRIKGSGRSQWQWGLGIKSRLPELHDFLTKNCLIRRLKSDVVQQVPTSLVAHSESNGVDKQSGVCVSRVANTRTADRDCMSLPTKQRTLVRISLPLSAGVNIHDTNGMDGISQRISVQLADQRRGIGVIHGSGSGDTAWERLGIAKLPYIQTRLVQLLQSKSKIIVFAFHIAVIDALTKFLRSHLFKSEKFDLIKQKQVKSVLRFTECSEVICIKGSTPPDTRHELLSRFSADERIKIAVLSLRAAGTGLDLSAADTVIFAELGWTPAELIQAEDRAHRYTQSSMTSRNRENSNDIPNGAEAKCGHRVTKIEYICARDTLDEVMWARVRTKFRRLSMCTNGTETMFSVQNAFDPDLNPESVASIKSSVITRSNSTSKVPENSMSPSNSVALDMNEKNTKTSLNSNSHLRSGFKDKIETDSNNISKYNLISFTPEPFRDSRPSYHTALKVETKSNGSESVTNVDVKESEKSWFFIVSKTTRRIHISDDRKRCLGSVTFVSVESALADEKYGTEEMDITRDMKANRTNKTSSNSARCHFQHLSLPLSREWVTVFPVLMQFVVEWKKFKPLWQSR